MLNYYGDMMAMELGERAKWYIPIYQKKGEKVCKVAFRDLRTGKKRFVKFELIEGVEGWVYVDIVDN